MGDLAILELHLKTTAQLVRLQGDGPLSFSDAGLAVAVRDLERSTGSAFPDSTLPAEARKLSEVVQGLALGDIRFGAGQFVSQFEVFLEDLHVTLQHFPTVRARTAAAQLRAVDRAISRFFEEKAESEAGDFARVLARSPWAEKMVAEIGPDLREMPAGAPSITESFSTFAAAAAWLEWLDQNDAARLAGLVRQLRFASEGRARAAWMAAVPGQPSIPDLYLRAWTGLFPCLRIEAGTPWLLRVLSAGVEVCSRARIKGMAQYAGDPEFLMSYGLRWLLPPDPGRWVVKSLDDFQRVLGGQISRWYFRPFRNTLNPAELVAGVLKAGRPLFYERVAAHALLQYGIVQSLPPSEEIKVFYVDLLAALQDNFELLLDGYVLREIFKTRLKTPRNWQKYLDALIALHFPQAGQPDCEWRKKFLAERGITCGREILQEVSRRIVTVN
jgi:hypothetical protein